MHNDYEVKIFLEQKNQNKLLPYEAAQWAPFLWFQNLVLAYYRNGAIDTESNVDKVIDIYAFMTFLTRNSESKRMTTLEKLASSSRDSSSDSSDDDKK